jgi:hypothetical protein
VTHVGQRDQSNIKFYIKVIYQERYIREVNKQYGTNWLRLRSQNVDYKRQQYSGSGTSSQGNYAVFGLVILRITFAICSKIGLFLLFFLNFHFFAKVLIP